MAQSHGLDGMTLENKGVEYLQSQSAAVTIIVILTLLTVLAATHIIVRSRQFAIALLNGQSTLTFILSEFAEGAKRVTVPISIFIVSSIAFLGWYNQFHYIGLLASGFIALISVYLLAMFCSALLCARILTRTPLIAAIKGAIPGKELAWGSYVVRAAITLFACSLFFSTIAISSQALNRQREAELWKTRSEASAIFVSGSAGEASFPALGARLRQLEKDGGLILAQQDWNTGLDATPQDLPQLLSNSRYAELELSLQPADSHTVRIVYPEDAPQRDIDRAVEGVHAIYEDTSTDYSIEFVPQLQNFTAFSYQSDIDIFSRELMLQRPVVTVLPPGLPSVSDFDLAAGTTQRTVLFTDNSHAIQLAEEPKLQGTLAGWLPVRDQWQETTAKAAASSRDSILNLAILLFVLTTVVVACAVTYSLRKQEFVRACFLNGVRFSRAYFQFIAVELLFVALPLLYLVYRHQSYLEAIRTYSSRVDTLTRSTAVTPTIVVLFAVMALAWCGIALWFARRRYATTQT